MTRFMLLIFTGTLAVVTAATDIKSSTKVICQSPFVEVGGRCIHLEYNTKGTWLEMRQFCQELGSDLANLADVQFYSDLILYIYSLNLPDIHIWIGATDEKVEGIWEWTDGSLVRMGTPFWANYGTQEQMPTGGTNQNCAIIDGFMSYYFNDYGCLETNGRALCEKLESKDQLCINCSN